MERAMHILRTLRISLGLPGDVENSGLIISSLSFCLAKIIKLVDGL